MFKGLRDEIIALNSDVNNVANSEKAKKLRKKLLKIGIILAIIGYIGTIGLFICTAVLMFNDVSAGFNGGGMGFLIPFFLIIPFAIMATIGTTLIKLALSIIIVGYTLHLRPCRLHHWQQLPKLWRQNKRRRTILQQMWNTFKKDLPKMPAH